MRVYNTLNSRKEEFIPIQPGKAGMYVCGVTVYDRCHLGHARAYVSFDIIKRYLQYRGYSVTHVQNFTDIDDKIIKKAREYVNDLQEKPGRPSLSEACGIITKKYTRDYFTQMDALGIKRADAYPAATQHINEMIEVVKELIGKGYAYKTPSGVYFSIEKFKDYGKLSGRALDGMQAGARVKSGEDKKHPLDFALWKSAGPDEPSWDSPFGAGRPGWHVECSAMSMKYLGETFDIHGGGADLIFPHNENEIAQSEALTGKPLANYWMHNGFVTIEKDKMSKSLNNFYTVSEILEKFSPETVRLFFLSAHYRSPVDFSEEELKTQQSKYRRLSECDKKILMGPRPGTPAEKTSPDAKKYIARFELHMDNDFNTPGALAVIFELARKINLNIDSGRPKSETRPLSAAYAAMREVLGIPIKDEKSNIVPARGAEPENEISEDGIKAKLELKEKLTDRDIKELLSQRETLRKMKNYELADAIRKSLEEFLNIKDTREGASWERK